MAVVEERAELHKTIWRSANDLRGSVDDANAFDYTVLSDEIAESDRAGINIDKAVFQPLCLIREKQVGDSYASGACRVPWLSDVGLVIRRSLVALRAKTTEYTGLDH